MGRAAEIVRLMVSSSPIRLITTWATTTPGETITLPLYNSGVFDAIVEWGDGSTSTITAYNDPDRIHAYAAPGTHTVKITGLLPSWSLNFAADRLKIRSFDLLGLSVSYFVNGLYGASSITEFKCDALLGVSLANAWRNCSELTLFPSLDVSAGIIFSGAWFGCSGLISFPLLSVSAGIDFSYSWYGCSKLTSFPLLDVSASTTFSYAWYNCTKLAAFPASMFDSCAATNYALAFVNCALSQTSVDNILVSINNAGTSNGTLNMTGGTSATPSATGLAAKTALQSRGWTVTTN